MDQPRWVDFGRWDEANRALLARMIAVENDLHGLRGAEQEHRALSDRIAVLEHQSQAEEAEHTGRRDRRWAIVLTAAAGIICPLIVTTIIALIHLRAVH
jgi:hypothetical protein